MGNHSFPPEMEERIAAFDEQARLKLAITSSAPPGAISYRVGCVKPGFLAPSEIKIRWFPSPTQRRPCVFPLNEYQEPKVPYPGYYAVAYFDGNYQLCCSPQIKVLIPFWHPMVRWYQGDLMMLLDGKRR